MSVRYLLVLLAFSLTASASTAEQILIGKVVGVPDGDSLTVILHNRPSSTMRVRLFGIDAPEKSQAFGEVARSFNSKQSLHRTVELKVIERDQYGRLVADVYSIDNGSRDQYLQELLVSNGYAWVYRRYSRSPRLIDLETKAKEQKLGLWNDSNPIPPWEYRKGARATNGRNIHYADKTTQRRGHSPNPNNESSSFFDSLRRFLLSNY